MDISSALPYITHAVLLQSKDESTVHWEYGEDWQWYSSVCKSNMKLG